MKTKFYFLPKRFWATVLLFVFAFTQAASPAGSARADDTQNPFMKRKAVFSPAEGLQLGEEVAATSSAQDDLSAATLMWNVLYSQGWETQGPSSAPGWNVIDYSNEGICWGDQNVFKNSGFWAIWVGSGCDFGNPPVLGIGYPGNIASAARYGPFSLEGYSDAVFEFYYNNDTEYGSDYFCYQVSSDGNIFEGECISGNTNGWVRESVSLKDYAGDPDVWIEFFFISDEEEPLPYMGTLVDDIRILYSTTAVFSSNKAQDGWVLESKKGSNKGGTLHAKEKYLRVGDSAEKQAYRSILSFNTASLPDGAVINGAQIRLRRHSMVGTPTWGTLTLDIRYGPFGANNLELTDFNRAASQNNVRHKWIISANNYYHITIDPAALPFINKTGTTQFRVRLSTKTNNDSAADFYRFFSADAGAKNAPQLIVWYTP